MTPIRDANLQFGATAARSLGRPLVIDRPAAPTTPINQSIKCLPEGVALVRWSLWPRAASLDSRVGVPVAVSLAQDASQHKWEWARLRRLMETLQVMGSQVSGRSRGRDSNRARDREADPNIAAPRPLFVSSALTRVMFVCLCAKLMANLAFRVMCLLGASWRRQPARLRNYVTWDPKSSRSCNLGARRLPADSQSASCSCAQMGIEIELIGGAMISLLRAD